MNIRPGILFVILLLAAALAACGPSGDSASPSDRSATFSGPGPGSGTAPSVGTAGAGVAAPDVSGIVFSGRLLTAEGDPVARAGIYLGGKAFFLHMMGAMEGAGATRVVAPGLRPVAYDDRIMPPGWSVGSTDVSGRFTVRLAGEHAGAADLLFTHPAPGHAHVPGILHVVRDVELRTGKALDLGEIRLPARGAIAGRVRRADGTPASGADVWCLPLDLGADLKKDSLLLESIPLATPFTKEWNLFQIRGTQADEQGRFTLPGLRPASYRLLVRRDSMGGVLPSVTVPAGGDPVPVEVDLTTEAAWLSGRVVDAESRAPIHAPLFLPRLQLRADADAKGQFRIGPVWPGSWKLRVVAAGYEAQDAGPFPVKAGETKKGIQVELQAVKRER